MTMRRAVIADSDTGFIQLLAEALTPYGFSLDVAESAAACLEMVANTRPEIVFVAVELPGKEGFSLFSRVKGISKVLPTILTTSTLPRTELRLHQKLKVHAEDYWDKQSLSADEIRERLSTILALGERMIEQITDEVTPPEGHDSTWDPVVAAVETELESAIDRSDERTGRLDREAAIATPTIRGVADVEALLAQLDFQRLAPALPPPPPPSRSAGPVTEDELLELRRELDEARRASRASPFSSDFSRLAENAREKDRTIARLEAEAATFRQELSGRAEIARELGAQLIDALHAIEGERRRVARLDEALGEASRALEAASERSHSQAQHDADALARLSALLESSRAEFAETGRRWETLQDEREARHVEELEAIRAEHSRQVQDLGQRLEGYETWISQLQEELRLERDFHVQTRRQWEADVAERQVRHVAEIEGLELERQRLVEAAEAKESWFEQSRERLEGELAAQRERSAQTLRDHETALAEAKRRHETRLEEAKRKHQLLTESLEMSLREELARDLEKDLEVSRRESQALLDSLRAFHEEELGQRDREHAAAIREASEALASLRSGVESSVAEVRTQYESRLATLEAEQVQVFQAQDRDNKAGFAALERRMKEAQARAIEEITAQHAQESLDQKAAYDAALAALESTHQASRQRLSEEFQAGCLELQRKLDESRLGHEMAMRSLDARHRQSLDDLNREQSETLAELEMRLGAEKDESLTGLSKAHARQLELEHSDHAQAHKAREAEHERLVSTLQASHAKDLAEREGELAEGRRQAIGEIAAERSRLGKQLEEERAQSNAKGAEVELRLKAALQEAERRSQEAVAEIEARAAEKRSRAQAALEAEWQQRLERTERTREQNENALRQEYETQLAALESSLRELRNRTAYETDAWAGEKRRLEKAVAEIESRHAEELRQAATQREAAQQRSEELIHDQRAQALQALQNEWQSKAGRLEVQHADALKALRQEADRATAELELRQKDSLAKREEELRTLRVELQQLRTRIGQIQAEGVEFDRRSFAEREAALEALRASLANAHAEDLARREAQWQQRFEVEMGAKVNALAEAMRAQRKLAGLETALREAESKQAAELRAAGDSVRSLESAVSNMRAARGAAEEKLRTLRREIEDKSQTIESLRAMIGDFSSRG